MKLLCGVISLLQFGFGTFFSLPGTLEIQEETDTQRKVQRAGGVEARLLRQVARNLDFYFACDLPWES